MNLVIDGHNLIPKIPGLALRDLDDEPKLIELVQEYCRRTRSAAELFFDGALPGFASGIKGGLVHIHAIRKGLTADEAILAYLAQKGRSARHFTLVSSDRHVQAQGHALGAAILSSEQFARELITTLSQPDTSAIDSGQPLSPAEVDEWLKLFNDKGHKEG